MKAKKRQVNPNFAEKSELHRRARGHFKNIGTRTIESKKLYKREKKNISEE